MEVELFSISKVTIGSNMRKIFLDYFKELHISLAKLDIQELEKVTDLLITARLNDQLIFTMGNGGSGSTASHVVCDLNKGVSSMHEKRYKVICLNDNMASVLAYANDLDYSDIFVEQLRNYFNEGDIVIGFSGSGNSLNVTKAIDYANENGGITIGFSGYDGGKLAQKAQYSIHVPIDDMQKSEDIHLILCHTIMQALMKY